MRLRDAQESCTQAFLGPYYGPSFCSMIGILRRGSDASLLQLTGFPFTPLLVFLSKDEGGSSIRVTTWQVYRSLGNTPQVQVVALPY